MDQLHALVGTAEPRVRPVLLYLSFTPLPAVRPLQAITRVLLVAMVPLVAQWFCAPPDS